MILKGSAPNAFFTLKTKKLNKEELKSQSSELSEDNEWLNSFLPMGGSQHPWLEDYMRESYESRDREQLDLIVELQRLKSTSSKTEEIELVNLALDYLNSAGLYKLRPSVAANGVRAVQIEALRWNFQRCVGQLERLSNNGDSEATIFLAHHCLDASALLSNIRKKHTRLIKPIARKSIFWPILKSRCLFFDDIKNPTHQSDAVFLRNLEVGKDHTIQGYKVKLSDELGGIILDFLNQVDGEKAGGKVFFPIGWRLQAVKLPPLSSKKITIDKWAEVLQLSLLELHSSREAMAQKYKHLVSRSKRITVNRILGELQSKIRTKLTTIAGAGRNADTTPAAAWTLSRTKNLMKKKSA